MPIRYTTNDVPQWGKGAFTPVPAMTPLSSSGGEQKRFLQQWSEAPDPNLAGMAATAIGNFDYQNSYAQVGQSADFIGVPDKTFVPGLPMAFRPVMNLVHRMMYWATAQNMGPNGPNVHMKIFSDNPLPIPAQNPGRVAMPAMRTQPKGTIIATAWPRPFISWPTWGTSRQA